MKFTKPSRFTLQRYLSLGACLISRNAPRLFRLIRATPRRTKPLPTAIAELDELFAPPPTSPPTSQEALSPGGSEGAATPEDTTKCSHSRRVHWPTAPTMQRIVQGFHPPSQPATALENVRLFNPDQKELLSRRKLMRQIEMQVASPELLPLAAPHAVSPAAPGKLDSGFGTDVCASDGIV